jgi:small subunit ribosomal protein S8
MSFSDPIADMLTRIRNALAAGQDTVQIPHSRMKAEIAQILKREGYIHGFSEEPGPTPQKVLRVQLKYGPEREPVIQGVRRFSRPGLRRYAGAGTIPHVLGGLGIAIVSTSNGLMTDREARRRKVGGEVLCTVW